MAISHVSHASSVPVTPPPAGVSKIGNPAGPSPTEKAHFQQQIQNKSVPDLIKMLDQASLKQWQKDDILKQFMQALKKLLNKDDNLSPSEKQKLQDLLNQLASPSNNGSNPKAKLISSLLQALGVPSGQADSIGSKLSGGGGGSV